MFKKAAKKDQPDHVVVARLIDGSVVAGQLKTIPSPYQSYQFTDLFQYQIHENGVGFYPYLPFSTYNEIVIKNNNVIACAAADPALETAYKEYLFRIQLPPTAVYNSKQLVN